jgi:hypothetical protein
MNNLAPQAFAQAVIDVNRFARKVINRPTGVKILRTCSSTGARRWFWPNCLDSQELARLRKMPTMVDWVQSMDALRE